MNDHYDLVGKIVELHLVSGKTFSGMVEFKNTLRVVLVGNCGTIVIQRDKIEAAVILDLKESITSIDKISNPRYYNNVGNIPEAKSESYLHDISLRNRIDQESYYGSMIPSDMLIGEETEPEVNLSITMSSLKNIKSEGETEYDSAKKDGSYIKKNKN